MKRAIAIRHVCFEDLGSLYSLLEERNYATIYHDAGICDLSRIAPTPEDILIVLGGPIGAYDDAHYPFIVGELRLIDRSLKQNIPILGICLGAQLLARALGARVYPGPQKEIGIAPIELSAEGRSSCLKQLASDFEVLHWHGDTFDLPRGAIHLASSQITLNQAFEYGSRVLALQFHIEAEHRRIEQWLVGHSFELSANGFEVSQLRKNLDVCVPRIESKGRSAFSEWLDSIVEPADGCAA